MDTLSQALSYLERGFSIIPLGFRKKEPVLKFWRPYQKKRASENLVKEWFSRKRNIGIITGQVSNLVAVDFDSEAAYQEFFNLYGGKPCPIQKTGSGGYHAFFSYPSGHEIRNISKSLKRRVPEFENLDLRANGGYVVAPPSIHPSGNSYQWIVELNGSIPELPNEFLSLIIEHQSKTPKTADRKKKEYDHRKTEYQHPEIDLDKREILETALQSPKVRLCRERMKADDLSGSDWAFLKELIKEGITDPTMLKYALYHDHEKLTKFNRTYRHDYLEMTVNNALANFPIGEPLRNIRLKIQNKITSIDLQKHEKIVVHAPMASGKTTSASKLVKKGLMENTRSLILVPLHSLGREWLEKLTENGIGREKITQLYGATHLEVDCHHISHAKKLLSIGHSKLFKRRFCNNGKCPKYDKCLHIRSYEKSGDSDVLIATHAHGSIHQRFFTLKKLENHQRNLVIVDEMPTLTHEVILTRANLDHNLMIFQNILENQGESFALYQIIRLTNVLLNMIEMRESFQIPDDWRIGISTREVNIIDGLVADWYAERKQKPQPNYLWHIVYLINNAPIKVEYDQESDCLKYLWSPRFRNSSTVLFLTATGNRQYIEKQLKMHIDREIGTDWTVQQKNLKVIQLIYVNGGRERLLNDKRLQENMKKSLDFIIQKHAGKRIALICTLGSNREENTAKTEIIDLLQPIAHNHNRQLVEVSTMDIQSGDIPSGHEKVPVVHYGVIGVNSLGNFDVIVELNALYYHDKAIKDSLKRKFKINPDEIQSEKQAIDFRTIDGIEQISKYQLTHHDPIINELIKLEIEQTEKADVSQTEGRFIRDDKNFKTIYRFHNVNITPFPNRTYKKWETFFKNEFANFIDPIELLTTKQREIWRIIKGFEDCFTYSDIRESLFISQRNLIREIQTLVSLGLIIIYSTGGGRSNETTFKRK